MWLLNLLAGEAGSGTGTQGTQQNPTTSYIIMGVLLVAIIGLFVWQSISGKKKQKEAQDMVNALKVGDRVKTIGGICGFVAEINNAENTFVLRTGMEGNESFVKFDKGAIYQTAPAKGSAVAAEEAKEEVKVEEKKEAPVEEKPAKKRASKKEKSADDIVVE